MKKMGRFAKRMMAAGLAGMLAVSTVFVPAFAADTFGDASGVEDSMYDMESPMEDKTAETDTTADQPSETDSLEQSDVAEAEDISDESDTADTEDSAGVEQEENSFSEDTDDFEKSNDSEVPEDSGTMEEPAESDGFTESEDFTETEGQTDREEIENPEGLTEPEYTEGLENPGQNEPLSLEEVRAFQDKVKIWKYDNQILMAYDSVEDIRLEYFIYPVSSENLLYSGTIQWNEQSSLYFEAVDFDAINGSDQADEGEDGIDAAALDEAADSIKDVPVRVVISDGISRFDEVVSQDIAVIEIKNSEVLEEGNLKLSWNSEEGAEGYLALLKETDGRLVFRETNQTFIDIDTTVHYENEVLIAPYRTGEDNVKYFGEAVELHLSDYESHSEEAKPGESPSDFILSSEGLSESVSTDAMFSSVGMPTDGNRYTVLLLDVSGSMGGTPLTKAKEAAVKFCTQMLASDGVNYISIVTYASDVKKANAFTNQLEVLQRQISEMSSGGGTNTNAALNQAIVLLEQAPDTATRNIVLLSDGLPQSGETTVNGHYSSSDNSLYKYGNAVYNTAKSIDGSWNLYSLGFFHSLSGSDLSFGRKLMSDLPANPDMYYEVTDVEKLEFMFGKIAEEITKSDLEKIYVEQHIKYINSAQYKEDIIPGFGGSLSQVLLDVRNDASVSGYNFSSKLSDALGFELDLTQEYELLLAELMVNDQTYKGVKDAFLTNLEKETYEVGSSVLDVLEQFAKDVQKADKKKMIELFNKLMEEDYLSDEYCKLYTEYTKVINESVSARQAEEALGKLSLGLEIADVGLSTASETIEYYCYAKAYQDTTEDFIATLVLLDYCAGVNAWAANIEGIEPATQLFELAAFQTAIEEFIDNMESYKKNNAKAIAAFAGEKLTSKTGSKIADKASDLLFSQMPILKIIPYIKVMLGAGLTLVDVFTDLDDRAASGTMLEKYYITNAMMDEVAKMWERGLTSQYNAGKEGKDIFRMAARFDETVNLYKTSLKLASDYGVKYEELRLADESESLLPSTKKMSWYSTAITLTGVEKLRADNILCHSEGLRYNHKSDIVLDTDKLKIFTIACPVAVEVKNDKGTQVAYLSDDACNVADGYEPYFYTLKNSENECIKVVALPENSNYSVSIVGTGDGSMDAYLGLYNGSEITSVKEFTGIKVSQGSAGYFGEEDEKGLNNLVFDNIEYSEGNEHKGYHILDAGGGSGALITTDQNQYYCPVGQSFTLTAKIQTPSAFQDGSRKYTGYLAMLENGSWVQLGAWYIDGGTVAVELPVSVSGTSTGNKRFTVSLFESDHFTTGASLYDCLFRVNILPESFDLTFDPDGGNCDISSKKITYGATYGDLPIPERAGYVFGGWFTEKNGKAGRVTASSVVKTTSNQVLYAYWKTKQEKPLLVNFDANGGSCSKVFCRYKEGDAYGTLPEPVRAGYLFTGWFTERINGTRIKPDMTAEAGTLYAAWKKFPIAMDECEISLAKTTYTYDGNKKVPSVSVTYQGAKMSEGKDYKIVCSNNINAGTAAMTVTGIGNYTGTKTTNFKINKAAQNIAVKASAASIAVGKNAAISITGNKGTVSYKSSYTPVATVNAAGTVTAKAVGTATITATAAATANYNAASKAITIKVVPAATSSITAANQATGIKLTWKGVAGATGYKVYRGSTLIKTIKGGSTVTCTDQKANTNGTKYTFKVVPTAATGNGLAKTLTTYRVVRPVITSVKKSAAKKMTVKWTKNAKATGYQIQYSTNKNFASGNKNVNIAKAAAVSKVIGSLAKNKTYYVRIRTYKTVGKAKYWSMWSPSKSIKIGTSGTAKTNLRLSKSAATINVGSKITLKATITGRRGTVKWYSSKKSVATVSSTGVVTGKKKGTATITAKVNGVKKTCKITVKSTPNATNSIMSLTAPEAAKKLGLPNLHGVGGSRRIYLKGELTSRKGVLQTRISFSHRNETKKGMWALIIMDKSVALYGIKVGMTGKQAASILQKAKWKKTKEEIEVSWDGYKNVYYKSTDKTSYPYKTKSTLEVRLDEKGKIWMMYYGQD